MAIVNNNLYSEIAKKLIEKNNKQNHKYLYDMKTRGADESPLTHVVPLFTEFFGPKVLSMMIISKNYGFANGSLNWPQVIIDQQLQTIRDSYSQWIEYKVYFWIDYTLAKKIQEATPSSDYQDQMDTVYDKIEQICAEMGDFGFDFKGALEEGKDESYFQPFIDEFFSDAEKKE